MESVVQDFVLHYGSFIELNKEAEELSLENLNEAFNAYMTPEPHKVPSQENERKEIPVQVQGLTSNIEQFRTILTKLCNYEPFTKCFLSIYAPLLSSGYTDSEIN